MSAYDDIVLATAGRLAYWKLDEPSGALADDAVGSNDLTFTGSYTRGVPALDSGGTTAAALSLSTPAKATGAASYAAAGTSYTGWFRVTPAGLAATYGQVFFNGTGTSGFGLYVNRDTVNGRLNFLYQDIAWRPTGFAPAAGVTYHFCVVVSAANVTRLYIDGILVYLSGAEGMNPPAGGFLVGGGLFDGTIGKVAVHAAELPAATVAALYRAGRPRRSIRTKPAVATWRPSAAPAGCRVYLPLADRHGPRVRNAVDGGLGTITGAPTWAAGDYGPQLGGFSATSWATYVPRAPVLGVYPFWWAVLFYGAGPTPSWIFRQLVPSIGLVYSQGSVTGQLTYSLTGGTTTAEAGASGLPVHDAAPHVAMGLSASPTSHSLHLDGVQVAASATNPGTFGAADPTLLLGVQTAIGGTPFPGSIVAFLAGNGAIPSPPGLAADLLSGRFAAIRAPSGLAALPPSTRGASVAPLASHHNRRRRAG